MALNKKYPLLILFTCLNTLASAKLLRIDKKEFSTPLASQFRVYITQDCPHCWQQYTEFKCAQKTQVIFYSLGGNLSELRIWAQRKKFSYPFYLQTEAEILKKYQSSPIIEVYSKENKLLYTHFGVMKCELLKKY